MAVLTPTATYTAQTAPAVASLLDYNKAGGKLREYTVAYTLLGTEAATDTLQILRLPKGFTLDCAKSSVTLADPGTTLTIDLGDTDTSGVGAAADPDRYADALVLSSGGNVGLASALATFGAAATVPYKTGSECDLVVTIDSANTLTASAKVIFHIVGTFE